MSNAVKLHRREVGRLAAGTDSEGRRCQPVCDNCLHMTVRQTASGVIGNFASSIFGK